MNYIKALESQQVYGTKTMGLWSGTNASRSGMFFVGASSTVGNLGARTNIYNTAFNSTPNSSMPTNYYSAGLVPKKYKDASGVEVDIDLQSYQQNLKINKSLFFFCY